MQSLNRAEFLNITSLLFSTVMFHRTSMFASSPAASAILLPIRSLVLSVALKFHYFWNS